MNRELRTQLISVTAYSSEGLRLLRKAYQALDLGVQVSRMSSIYRVRGKAYKPAHIHDLRSVTTFEGLSVCLEIKARFEPKESLSFLKSIEEDLKSEQLHRSLSLNLLFYEDLTCISPELTIPHPQFHRRADMAIPAAEIWGDKIHPILGTSLYAIAQSFGKSDWGEFYSQGQTLLDF
ncbi:MAG: 2-amino-4-hydroxy-6-hydroxymethyldihydropteridine diphosphokinase [Bdellovibrionales bacterium]|nr:2-amino-4-hydroxy-6-hydroxymethyldihydropteridine diphosphokinase [Bdellovibrionales bacterium]